MLVFLEKTLCRLNYLQSCLHTVTVWGNYFSLHFFVVIKPCQLKRLYIVGNLAVVAFIFLWIPKLALKCLYHRLISFPRFTVSLQCRNIERGRILPVVVN